jgi:hypothetical protein
VMSHSRTDSKNCAVSASIVLTNLHFSVNKGCKALIPGKVRSGFPSGIA